MSDLNPVDARNESVLTRVILGAAAALEFLTGLALLIYPPLLFRLLFGSEVGGVGAIGGRVAGIALISLAIACWPGNRSRRAVCAMLTYNFLVMFYFFCLGVSGAYTGILLWPVVGIHAVLTVILAWSWSKARKATVTQTPPSP